MAEEALAKVEVTRDELGPVVSKTLGCMARQGGCATILTTIFGKNIQNQLQEEYILFYF